METKQVAEVIRKWAEREPLIRRAYIFGSRARNENDADADLDVAVELNSVPGDLSPLATWFYESDRLRDSLQSLFLIKVDLQVYTDQTAIVKAGIEKSSIFAYDSEY